MVKRKRTKTYLFTVEGETEKWYFEWLRNLINNTEESFYKVSLKTTIQKNPLKYVKSLYNIYETDIYHFCDYESNEDCHVKNFKDTMSNLKAAKKLNKKIDYRLGYSNFTFDLWIILHKMDCNGPKNHRDHYLAELNKSYNEHFENMDSYKSEDNFKRILGTLNLSNVTEAVKRAKSIMEENKKHYKLHECNGYKYYTNNPSLTVGEAVEQILMDCKL
ncbi:MAG: RloB family protein [Treponema sp.]|nr:RloB family protein [Treponema sp.]